MKYFTVKELCYSSTAQAKGVDNTPPGEAIEKLTELTDNVLDPLREWYGKPIRVNSGYRNQTVNKLVGSKSANSQHIKGEAADITTGSKQENKKLFNYIKDNLEYDQLIDESNFSWIHVSFRKGNNRMQVLSL